MNQEAACIAILNVARDTSFEGAGLSLEQALVSAGYSQARKELSPSSLVPLLRKNSHLVESWLQYSEDKRTDGGWYLLRSGEIGQVSAGSAMQSFSSLEEAVAEYVLRELDFWAGLRAAG